VLSWGHPAGPAPGYRLHAGHEVFISSAGGRHWSLPRTLWPQVGSIHLPTWWIDGSLATDAGGNLYATWDTQSSRGDIGWLSVSRDGGRSCPVRAARDLAGDAFGIVAPAPHELVLSWGSAVGHSTSSQVWSAVVRVPARR
jgi:hypothetical protein